MPILRTADIIFAVRRLAYHSHIICIMFAPNESEERMVIICLGSDLHRSSCEPLFTKVLHVLQNLRFVLASGKNLAVSPQRLLSFGLAKHITSYMLGALALSRSGVSVRISSLTADGC